MSKLGPAGNDAWSRWSSGRLQEVHKTGRNVDGGTAISSWTAIPMKRSVFSILGVMALVKAFGLVLNSTAGDIRASDTTSSVPLDISKLRNNRGFGMRPGDADFDGRGSSYPAQYIPQQSFTYAGVNYLFPQYQQGNGNDNVLAQGQTLDVPRGRYIGVHMLAAAETAIATGSVTAVYSSKDASTGNRSTQMRSPVLVDPFWDWPYPYGGDLIFPYHLTRTSLNYNRSMIFHTVNWLDSSQELTSLKVPNVSSGAGSGPGGGSQNTRMHIFAITLVAARGSGLALDVQQARSTNSWLEGTNKTQIVKATINNVGTQWALFNNSVSVSVTSTGLETVKPALIKRLRPGDQIKIQIGVKNKDGVPAGSNGSATLVISGKGFEQNSTFEATFGIMPYQPTFEDIYRHESPPWFNNAKYGIFIHWGVYAVPGWGNVGRNETYAEWYWWNMQRRGDRYKDRTYAYHRDTYGPRVEYDDFIPQFTASAFNPKEWVDLFADAGARYFVQVSKHHDGYALFDLPRAVSERTSVALPPHRNLLQELFDAAATHQPQLRRATYFSLPEWFHPAYAPLGFANWPGGNATNPYTGLKQPYTGYNVAVHDYVADVILPSQRRLAAMGTDIMWCDIGGPNATAAFAAEYFNDAAAQGRQVLLNNRCGTPGDFDTPEYARYDATRPRKWESSRGLDPYSYGFNRATPDAAYMAPGAIVTSLVDIVAKNGNFLLDIGPRADGSILPIQQKNLREAGRWIKGHGEAIFDTAPWPVTPEEGENIRFTQSPNAFYIFSLVQPGSTIVIKSPVPYVAGDEIQVVGGRRSGSVVPSRLLPSGSVEISIPLEIQTADDWTWVFKIRFDQTLP